MGENIRFFTGLVMVVLLLSPILQLFQEQDPLQIMERYEQGMKDWEKLEAGGREKAGEQRHISIQEISEDSEDIIEVEEIKIERKGQRHWSKIDLEKLSHKVERSAF